MATDSGQGTANNCLDSEVLTVAWLFQMRSAAMFYSFNCSSLICSGGNQCSWLHHLKREPPDTSSDQSATITSLRRRATSQLSSRSRSPLFHVLKLRSVNYLYGIRQCQSWWGTPGWLTWYCTALYVVKFTLIMKQMDTWTWDHFPVHILTMWCAMCRVALGSPRTPWCFWHIQSTYKIFLQKDKLYLKSLRNKHLSSSDKENVLLTLTLTVHLTEIFIAWKRAPNYFNDLIFTICHQETLGEGLFFQHVAVFLMWHWTSCHRKVRSRYYCWQHWRQRSWSGLFWQQWSLY